MITKDGFKDRQLHIEDYLCVIPAERGRKTGVSVYQRIAGGDDIITDFWTNNLLELITRKENLNKAYLQVKRNKGAGGIDGMQVDKLLPYLRDHQSELIQQLREGKYRPNPVRRVEIPKEGGKTRKLGIPEPYARYGASDALKWAMEYRGYDDIRLSAETGINLRTIRAFMKDRADIRSAKASTVFPLCRKLVFPPDFLYGLRRMDQYNAYLDKYEAQQKKMIQAKKVLARARQMLKEESNEG